MDSLGKVCTGCGLCSCICPQKAITMCENKEGFLSPVIDNQACDDCGLCISICETYKKQSLYKKKPLHVVACQTKDQKWLIESTAGGFFPTFAKWIIEQGGVVFGTAYNKDMFPVVCKAKKVDALYKFNGSKYVQSNLSVALNDIKKELETGKLVFFSGTPCQVKAVNTYCEKYIGKNLITMDVVCYGVPSQGLFRAFLKEIEQKYNGRIIDYRFRDKHNHGWSHTTVVTLINANGEKTQYEEEDYKKVPYYKMFGARNCFRPECYSCNYNTLDRVSDFTTGNFWGIEGMTDRFDTYNGVSMLLINTPIAEKMFDSMKDSFYVKDMTIDQAVQANDALVHTCKYPRERDAIYKCFSKHGFNTTYKKFYSITPLKIVKNKIKSVLKRVLLFVKRKENS